MPTISTLTVDVEARTSRFSTGLKVAAAGLATLAAGAAYAFGKFEESDKITKQTDAVLKSMGDSAGVTAKQVSDLASAISMKSGIDDEAIQSSENLLLTFKNISNQAGKNNDVFNQTTQVVTDMSVALGQDLKSSAIQVGKALNDPTVGLTALRRVGVSFSEQQAEQITQWYEHGNVLKAQKTILQELTAEFGGSAAAQATDSEKMRVAMENLAETVGKLLAPAFTFLAQKITEFTQFLMDNAGPAFRAVGDWLQGVWDKVKPLAEIIGGALVDAWHALVGAVNRLLPDLKKLWTELQPILKVVGALIAIILVLAAKILGPVITAIGFLIDIQVKLYTAVLQAYNKIGGAILGIIAFFVRLWDGARENFGKVIDFIKDIPDKIKAFFSNAGQWLFDAGRQVLIGLWNGLKSMFTTVWNGLTGWVGSLIDKVKGFLHIGSPSKVFEDIGRNMMAGMDQGIRKGAFDVQGTLRGLTPGFDSVGLSGGGDVVLQVDGVTFARIARNQLLKLGNRNAGTGL